MTEQNGQQPQARQLPRCPWCFGVHMGLCHRISAIEYRDDGRTPRRIEFHAIVVAPAKAENQADPNARFETDEELRARLLPMVGDGSVNTPKVKTAEGKALDELASFYGAKREQVTAG